ncbi:MAG: hypothetical protein FWD79_03645 [Desulfobulbus sp.]|nr:hypothetical protein [Desulfobulbus sp.]
MISKWSNHVIGNRPKHAFEIISQDIQPTDNDIESFIRLYILGNIPNFIIEKKPILFDIIRLYIATALGIDAIDIKLTGSTQLGFSLNPDKWMKDYGQKSDLDFFAVSEKLFNFLQQDIYQWKNKKNINSKEREKLDHAIHTSTNLGFISTKDTYEFENSKNANLFYIKHAINLTR